MWIIVGLVLVAVLGSSALFFTRGASQTATAAPSGWQEVTIGTGPIEATVNATGNIEAQAQADLRFTGTGTVKEILVKAGDKVNANQPLARIDDTDLRLQVEQNEAAVKEAQAGLDDLLNGASAQDVAEAQARVAQAQNQYQQTASSVSQADIAAAQADLDQARARLARLQSGPAQADVASGDQRVVQAQTALEQARVSLSAAKEQARANIDTRANALRNAQADYERVYWDNRKLEDQLNNFGQELPKENKDQEAAALRAVQDAEAALETARIAYEQAKQDEITTLQTREADLVAAQAGRDQTLAGAKPEEVAEAQAAVQRAEAKLVQLTGANRSSSLAAQASGITIAQAALDKLLADPSASSLAKAEAAVARAEVGLKQAQRNLELATLTAPFAATVARIDMRVGEPAAQTSLITIADISSYHVKVPVDELDVAQLSLGQNAIITLDALPGKELTGKVTNIAPVATRTTQGTTNYEVTVTLDNAEEGVRTGMTAVVRVITSAKTDAVLVPRRAVQSEGGTSYVLIPTAGQPNADGTPASERREVTLGLSNSENVEIVNGLQAGEKVLVQDVDSTFNPGGR
jgi:HlyD family secretion protein